MSFPLPGGGGEASWTSGTLSRVDKLHRLLTLCLHGVFGHLKDSGGVFGVEIVACAFNLH